MFGYGTLSYAYAVLTTYRLFLLQAETERRRARNDGYLQTKPPSGCMTSSPITRWAAETHTVG